MKPANAFKILLCLLLLTGCAFLNESARLEIKRVEPQPSIPVSYLTAGAAKEDITPPPGMPLAGYSLWANDAKGFRTRLYARAVYLKSTAGTPVALVQCDLLAGSVLLNRRVAELIADQTDIGMENLMIAGTHTHSGPGNFFDNNFYNDHASNASGFHQDYFEFLSQKIARAVIRAYQDKRPAKIASGKIQLWNLTRNRSLESFLANANLPQEKPPDIYQAVNPDLYLIRVDVQRDDGRYRPLAAISSFSIHGTAVPMQNNLYNGDVFAFIEREVEYGIKNHYKTPWDAVHAAFNGTHADNSPNYVRQGFPEAQRLGTSVGKTAFDLFRSLDDKLKSDVVIRFATREVDLFSERCFEEICLCDRPVVGSALAAGADDGPSPVISKLPWLRQGSPRWFFTKSCQGHKRVLGGPLQYLILPKKDFPHQLFLQIIQIDDVLLIPLPFETTREAGARIAKACLSPTEKNNPKKINHVAVVSCANGYLGYMTTPEEYRLQRYEGGHTLYGPQTQPFLSAQISAMADGMTKENIQTTWPAAWFYDLRIKKISNKRMVSDPSRKILKQPSFVAAGTDEEPYWSFLWEDLPPKEILWDQPVIRVEQSADGLVWEPFEVNGIPVDDSGYDVAVICTDVIKEGTKGIYESRWYNPAMEKTANGKSMMYRFAVWPRAGQDWLYSSSFQAEIDTGKQSLWENYSAQMELEAWPTSIR